MLGLVIIGMMGQAQSCARLDRIPVAEELELSPMAMNIYSLGTAMSLPSNIAHVDSGTTRHASGCRALFPEHLISNRKPQLSVRVASGTRLPVEFTGVMQLHVQGVKPKGSTGIQEPFPTTLGLTGALFVPGMPPTTTLISTKQLFKQERIKTYLNDALYLELPNGVRVGITETDTSYLIPDEFKSPGQCRPQIKPVAFSTLAELPIDLIHQRLCHFSFERIKASADCTKGLNLTHVHRMEGKVCEPCVRGGGRKKAAEPLHQKYTRFGERVTSDSCAMPKSTPFGFENMVTFYDRATNYLAIYYTRTHTNEEMRACFQQFEADHKDSLKFGHVETWHCDNHGEFQSKDMDSFLRELGVKQTFIVPWNPQQNPSERANGIVLRPLRIMLAAANVSVRLWPFAVNQIQMVHNSLANRGENVTMPHRSAYEMRLGWKSA
jgi:hypothetical protein